MSPQSNRRTTLVCAGACLLFASGCTRRQEQPAAGTATAPAAATTPARSPARPIEVPISMRRVRLHLTQGIALDIAELRGVMVSRSADGPPVFDDDRSYVLRVDAARIAVDTHSLTNLMNEHVFAYRGAPLSELSVSVNNDGRLAMKGTLHKGISVPFSTAATIAATDDGRLRLHVESVKAVGVPVKRLMDVLGLELEDVMDLKKRRDIALEEDDLFISLAGALPPPEIRGRLTGAALTGQRMELTFAGHEGAAPARSESAARNYVYFRGGSIRFGRMTMTDADLELIDADPRDPFDFFPGRYDKQLVAGYSKNTASGGFRVFMPDYDDLERRPRTNLRPPARR